MLLHIQTVSMLSNRNGMTLSNLVSTFAPCMISQTSIVAPPPPPPPFKNTQKNELNERHGLSLDDIDMHYSKHQDDNLSLSDDESQDSIGLLINTSTPAKIKRNQSIQCKNFLFLSSIHNHIRAIKNEQKHKKRSFISFETF